MKVVPRTEPHEPNPLLRSHPTADRAWREFLATLDLDTELAPEREGARQRALRGAAYLARLASILAEPDLSDETARDILSQVTRVSEVISGSSSDDRSLEKRATMALVHAIWHAAVERRQTSDGGEDGRHLDEFRTDWPKYGAALADADFWAAVNAWIDTDTGIAKDKWKPVCAAIESAGLGIKDPFTVARQFRNSTR